MSGTDFEIEAAQAGDEEGIVGVARLTIPSSRLVCMPLGCAGFSGVIREQIALGARVSDSVWTVARTASGGIAGFVELRRTRIGLFLNHIHVRPEHQGKGLGRRLFQEAIRRAERSDLEVVLLDVFEDLATPLSWYHELGFRTSDIRSWRIFSISEAGSRATGGWVELSGIPQANCLQERLGFSQFTLRTSSGAYEIGRLGDGVFRTLSRELIQDGCALAELHRLDRRRDLLLLGPECEVDLPLVADLGRALRMVAPRAEVLARLEAR